MGSDNWQYRQDGMRCSRCIFYVVKRKQGLPGVDDDKPTMALASIQPDIGRCRRHAPTMNGFPVVFGHDWCGDHKRDENKVAA